MPPQDQKSSKPAKGLAMAIFTVKDKDLFIDGHKVLKAWESFTGWFWFATEKAYTQDSWLDGGVVKNDQIWHGFVQGFEEEWGHFSQGEIEAMGKFKVWEIKAVDLPHAGRRQTGKYVPRVKTW